LCEDVFSIFGDQGFYARQFDWSGVDDAFIPKGKLKAIKKVIGECLTSAYAAWQEERLAKAQSSLNRSSNPTPATEKTLRVKIDRIETLEDVLTWHQSAKASPLKEIIFEPKRTLLKEQSPALFAKQLYDRCKGAGLDLRLALPTVLRAWDEPLMAQYFKYAHEAGVTRFEVGNLGGLSILKSWGMPLTDVAGDFTLYTLNSAAFRFWQTQGLSKISLSIEDDKTNIEALAQALTDEDRSQLSVILYKDTPLFIAESCSLTALHNGCPTAKVCGYRPLVIENDQGERFHVAHEACKSIVYGDEAYAVTSRTSFFSAIGVSDFRIDLLTRPYESEKVTEILAKALNGQSVAGTYEANFNRTLL